MTWVQPYFTITSPLAPPFLRGTLLLCTSQLSLPPYPCEHLSINQKCLSQHSGYIHDLPTVAKATVSQCLSSLSPTERETLKLAKHLVTQTKDISQPPLQLVVAM